MSSPNLKLNNGYQIPVLGLGTYASSCGEVIQAVKDAIDAGYRYFDCAHFYGNEAEVGAGIKAKIEDGTVKREDLFITSKLWNTYHPYDMVVPTCKLTLQNLGLDYLDLYLVHWPFAWKEGEDLWPIKNGKTQFSDVDYLDTWRGMEDCVTQGLTKSIGLSNFNSEQIDRLLVNCKIKPVVNQVEVNPHLNQKKLIEFCRSRDIIITGYCPLGRPTDNLGFLKDKKITNLAAKYGKTPAQIVLNYLTTLGISVIPKSVNKSRIAENINIFNFELKPEDISVMDSLNKNIRICGLEDNNINIIRSILNTKYQFFPFLVMYKNI